MKRSKIIALVVSLLLIFPLAACGRKDNYNSIMATNFFQDEVLKVDYEIWNAYRNPYHTIFSRGDLNIHRRLMEKQSTETDKLQAEIINNVVLLIKRNNNGVKNYYFIYDRIDNPQLDKDLRFYFFDGNILLERGAMYFHILFPFQFFTADATNWLTGSGSAELNTPYKCDASKEEIIEFYEYVERLQITSGDNFVDIKSEGPRAQFEIRYLFNGDGTVTLQTLPEAEI